ncbi:kinase-like protein [Aspergillus brunneoviolaceus CBS 621.78]|uniref:Kinase-like protein n=1 Tax=Aspergillus brunneoviolaceus CBS 621.78 TaxID=1450534 RepID=A0ACD1G7P7_9EURO|nr:kinase-like protein [Aspergillus brunneoviolaceus CBS 621.78]RAH45151.1 kinase-like protein [Aspergillus brunneoviolaceus CBS 621.78]
MSYLEEHPQRAVSDPRTFPTSGCKLIDASTKIEEKTLPSYISEYQVISKIGEGGQTAVWLARDLVLDRGTEHGIGVYNRIQSIETDRPGQTDIRKLLDHFCLHGPNGRHACLVHELLGMSLLELDEIGRSLGVKDPVPRLDQAKPLIRRGAHLIHADLQMENLLLPAASPVRMSKYEENVIKCPGLPVLCVFGETRFGGKHNCGRVMPDFNRAPKVILGFPSWDYKVDSWGAGMLTWDSISTRTLITNHKKDGHWDDGAHIAELVALLGHPPRESTRQGTYSHLFWDANGYWTDLPRPNIDCEDLKGFLRWLRRALQWNPKVRPTILDLFMDPWLMSAERRPGLRGLSRYRRGG